jgi:integrase
MILPHIAAREDLDMAATIRERTRTDGAVSCHVRWRTEGARDGKNQMETFSAGTTRENRANAKAFKLQVDAAGQQWPDGWVKGVGYAELTVSAEREQAPSFLEAGLGMIERRMGIAPSQRKRYKQQLHTLQSVVVYAGETATHPFMKKIHQISYDDLVAWRRQSAWALKTQKNYHGLIAGVFAHAMVQGWITDNPAAHGTAPSNRKVKEQQGEKRYLTEREFFTVCRLAPPEEVDFLMLLAGTGFRFGEATALWCGDVNLAKAEITINKAWVAQGEDGETEIPPWLRKLLKPKHTLRGHYLGSPKSLAARRTIGISPTLVGALRPHVEGRAADDFLFTTPTGLAIHGTDYTERVWSKLTARCVTAGVLPFTRHDLRHSHVAWLMAGGVDLYAISRRLGHADYYITTNTYGHLLRGHEEHMAETMDALFAGVPVRNPKRRMRIVKDAASEPTSAAAP